MGRLVFRAADVRRVVEHSLNAPRQFPDPADPEKPEPSVLLVHDRGVYLMSNGQPRDIINPESSDSYVAYACGCDPEKDADWYDTAHDLVGGDDFGETLPWARVIKDAIDKGARQIIVAMSARKVALKFK